MRPGFATSHRLTVSFWRRAASMRGPRRLVLSESARQIAFGIAAGLIGALALTRVLQGLLYAVSPTDPMTFATVTVLLAAGALAAS